MMSIGSKFLQVIKDYSGDSFFARQHANACRLRDIVLFVRLSVRLSVCPMPVLSDKRMDYISSYYFLTFW